MISRHGNININDDKEDESDEAESDDKKQMKMNDIERRRVIDLWVTDMPISEGNVRLMPRPRDRTATNVNQLCQYLTILPQNGMMSEIDVSKAIGYNGMDVISRSIQQFDRIRSYINDPMHMMANIGDVPLP